MKYSEGSLLDGRYQLKRFIGSGTFGEVWVANDTATDVEVAIKVYVAMDELGLNEFKKEFQISFELNHTNLLHANYLGVNMEDKRPYLVMPFCPDGSVSKYLGRMTEADIWRFIRDVASGLAYLHSKNPPIIHQDIKPDNILILKNGDFVITDFGISKQLRSTLRRSATSMNSAGAISYMGPERWGKQYQAVKASDIWSLGASIFELATEELPFCGMGGNLLRSGAEMPELPDTYSRTLNMICQACMVEKTWNRPTAQQLADFAIKYIEGETLKVTWKIPEDIVVPENIIVENSNKPVEPEPVVTPPHDPGSEPSDDKKEKKEDPGFWRKTKKMDPNNTGTNTPPVDPGFHIEKKDKPIAAWVWALAAITGLLVGLLLNYLS